MSQEGNPNLPTNYRSDVPAGQPMVEFQNEPKRKSSGLNFWTALVLLSLIGTLGWLAFYFGTAKLFTGAISSIGENFISENITNTFLTQNQRVASTDGNILVVANVESTEIFTRGKNFSVSGYTLPNWMQLSSTIEVPATFQYHVRLDDPWLLTTNEKECIVKAPQVRPTLPVAFDTTEIVKENKGIWSTAGNMETLEKSVTANLQTLAQSDEKIDAVREASRESIAKFVKNWLLREDHWRSDRFTQITVYFADEEVPNPEELPPTLTLDRQAEVGPAPEPLE